MKTRLDPTTLPAPARLAAPRRRGPAYPTGRLTKLVVAAALVMGALSSTAPAREARPVAIPPRVEVVAVCGESLTAARADALAAGDTVPLREQPVRVRTGPETSTWLLVHARTSVFVGPATHLRLSPDSVVLERGAVEIITDRRPIRIASVASAPAAEILAGSSVSVRTDEGALHVEVRAGTLRLPGYGTDDVATQRGPKTPAWAGRVSAGEAAALRPEGAAPLPLVDTPRPKRAARCRGAATLVPLSALPISTPELARVVQRQDAFLSAMETLGAAGLGDSVGACGCVEAGGGGVSGGFSGGSTRPDIERRR